MVSKVRRWCWRNKAWAVAGMAVLLLLLGVVWYFPLVTIINMYSRDVKRLEAELVQKKTRGEVLPTKPTLRMHIVSPQGRPIEGASCRLIVGGFPSDDRGLPSPPKDENCMSRVTDAKGNTIFEHDGLQSLTRHVVSVAFTNYSSETLFLDHSALNTGVVTVVIFKPKYVNLRYAFQPTGDFNFRGQDVVFGKVTLYPMHGGSYRPPARSHFSFKQNKIVGSSGVLDVGIGIDQRGGVLYFGESNGRFDHCTDLGRVSFEETTTVDPDILRRVREDTPILPGHTYIYESNIYPPSQRTHFTGFDVAYAKIFVESVAED
jgi:hypothetical protein